MTRITKLSKIIILLVVIYSIYIYIKIPSLTEGFTNNIRETLRPTIRNYRLKMDDKINKLNNITENFKIKLGV
jgi:hypothetical protein